MRVTDLAEARAAFQDSLLRIDAGLDELDRNRARIATAADRLRSGLASLPADTRAIEMGERAAIIAWLRSNAGPTSSASGSDAMAWAAGQIAGGAHLPIRVDALAGVAALRALPGTPHQPPEIAVTTAMVDAGLEELRDHRYDCEVRYMLECVFRAMCYASAGHLPIRVGSLVRGGSERGGAAR